MENEQLGSQIVDVLKASGEPCSLDLLFFAFPDVTQGAVRLAIAKLCADGVVAAIDGCLKMSEVCEKNESVPSENESDNLDSIVEAEDEKAISLEEDNNPKDVFEGLPYESATMAIVRAVMIFEATGDIRRALDEQNPEYTLDDVKAHAAENLEYYKSITRKAVDISNSGAKISPTIYGVFLHLYEKEEQIEVDEFISKLERAIGLEIRKLRIALTSKWKDRPRNPKSWFLGLLIQGYDCEKQRKPIDLDADPYDYLKLFCGSDKGVEQEIEREQDQTEEQRREEGQRLKQEQQCEQELNQKQGDEHELASNSYEVISETAKEPDGESNVFDEDELIGFPSEAPKTYEVLPDEEIESILSNFKKEFMYRGLDHLSDEPLIGAEVVEAADDKEKPVRSCKGVFYRDSVKRLELSARAMVVLEKAKVKRVNELVAQFDTFSQLSNYGEKSGYAILEALSSTASDIEGEFSNAQRNALMSISKSDRYVYNPYGILCKATSIKTKEETSQASDSTEVLDTNLRDIGISPILVRRFADYGIRTIGDAERAGRDQMQTFRGIGPTKVWSLFGGNR